MNRQKRSARLVARILVGVTFVSVLATAVGAPGGGTQDVQTPGTPVVLKAQGVESFLVIHGTLQVIERLEHEG